MTNLLTDIIVRRMGSIIWTIRECTTDEANRMIDTIVLEPGMSINRVEYFA